MGKCTVQWKQLVIQHIQQISKTKTTHSTRELKNTNSKPKEPAEKKKSFKKTTFSPSQANALQCEKHDPFQLLQVVSSTYSSQIYTAGFAKKTIPSPELSMSDKILFFFLNQNTFYRIPNQNVLFKASFFYNIFSSLKDDSHAAV